jgi:polyisoprenyl-phosphate glycosyltransferase
MTSATSMPSPSTTKARLSIVVPVYYSAPNLPDTIPQLLALRESLGDVALELVFVDDRSGDESLEMLREWQAKYPDDIQVLRLSRNFGSMAAILAGIEAATGDCIGVITADLQDPPELLVQMVGHWRHGTKVVLAVRADREDGWLQRKLANTYYALLQRYALPDYPSGGFDCFLIDRQIRTELLRIREKNTNLMSLIFWLGFSPLMIPYVRRARTKGTSRWTLSKKIKLFIDSFVAFSYAPIRFLSLLGATVALSSFAYAGFVFAAWAFRGIPVQGFASLIILLAFTAGVQMLMLGILGEYLWRTLDETRRRPAFVVDEHWPRRTTTPE